jgi:pimeloyl-ACP methyl ester carboxylesterase
MGTEPTTGQTVSVNEMEMYYEVRGEGEPLLLLHGFMGRGSDWEYVFKNPPDKYRLIVPDLRGHGRSTNPSMQFTMRQAALDVYALLDHLQIERFKAIGLSAGGNALLHMATQQPLRIEAMVLVSAAPYFPEPARMIMRGMTVESQSEEQWQVLRGLHLQGDDQIRALLLQGNALKDSYDDMNFTPPYLSTIKARTLIVHGDHDALYPIDIPTELYTSIPHSSLWIIPDSGHGPIFGELTGVGETTARFAEVALNFLRDE